jgi:DNA (cytosine-5)-methyltransferase 1
MGSVTVLNVAIGESKRVPRIWMEGAHLSHAGLRIGSVYRLRSSAKKQLELCEAEEGYKGDTFKVSSRTRHGVVRPLFELRSGLLREVFKRAEKVRVAIREGVIVISDTHLSNRIAERVQAFFTKLRSGSALSVCSLFHGGGVMDKAFHHGMKRSGLATFVQVAIEMSQVYLSSSLRNNPELFTRESIVICSDIRDLNIQHNPPTCNVLLAGLPCVGASRAGMAKNGLEFAEEHEDAGAMFFSVLEAIKAMNPIVALLECVPEFLKTAGMSILRSVMNTLGYRLHETVLNGNDYGALEARDRMIVVAVCKSLPEEFSFDSMSCVRTKEATVNDVVMPTPLDAPCWKEYKHLAEKAVRDKAAGKGFAKRQLLTGQEAKVTTVGRGYAKGRSTEPFLLHPDDPSLMRLFHSPEHADLKGIPQTVAAGESETVAHEIYGQSVVYPKIEAVAHRVGSFLSRVAASVMPQPLRMAA